MNGKFRIIQVAAETAELLEARAAARGVSVSDLIAGLVTLDAQPVAGDADEIVELDRRWNAVKAEQATVPHEDVVRWLNSWGTAEFKAWCER